jgi:hypothetical protein
VLTKQQPPKDTASNNNLIKTNDTLPHRTQSKKEAGAYGEIPSLKTFIAHKLANGNEGM